MKSLKEIKDIVKYHVKDFIDTVKRFFEMLV